MSQKASLVTRLWQYQKERFPIANHGLLIVAFSFSAISLSRQIRGVSGFISLEAFIACFLYGFLFFLRLRIADEHKDAVEDKAVRPHLPVPRGLVTLKELKILDYIAFAIQACVLLLFYRQVIPVALIALGYDYLMRNEFFAHEFLKKRLWLYTASHMMILPFADLVSSAFDWAVAEQPFPWEFLWVFALSYSNGLVLEIGRKIRHPSQENAGYMTYSAMLGPKKATALWLWLMAANVLIAVYIGYSLYNPVIALVLGVLGISSTIPAISFYAKPSEKGSKAIESISGIWALGMYLSLGIAHFL